jgi:hypothetical protein
VRASPKPPHGVQQPLRNYPDVMRFSTRDFVRLAEAVFGWLQDRGFTVVETSAENLYGSVLFANEVSHVRVALDIHDQSLDVQVGPLAGSRAPDGARLPDGTRAQFPLWLLLWVKQPMSPERVRSAHTRRRAKWVFGQHWKQILMRSRRRPVMFWRATSPFLAVPIWPTGLESRPISPVDLGRRRKREASGPSPC